MAARPKQILVGPVRPVYADDVGPQTGESCFNVYQNLTQTRFTYATVRAAQTARDSLLEASNAEGIPTSELEDAFLRYVVADSN